MVIDFKLTGRCNSNCKFCWDFCKGMQEEKLSLIIKILDKLVGVVDVISLTGGEPLVVPYFDELLEEISNRNFKIYLSTNGYLLKEHLDPIVKNVDISGKIYCFMR